MSEKGLERPCATCGATFSPVRSPNCAACRNRARLDHARAYEAAKRAARREWLAAQSPEVRKAERQKARAGYRRANPPPICPGCGKPTARVNQDICDGCAPNAAARQAKRDRARARWLRLRGGNGGN